MFSELFISTAHAMATPGQNGAAGQGSALASFAPLVIIFAIFYFLLIRPQKKQQKQHQELLAAIAKGDKVITRGGMHATVYGIADNIITLEIADKVQVKINREAIATIVK